jgi:Holliday junction resolvasome RuvABC DNA-binding subunit
VFRARRGLGFKEREARSALEYVREHVTDGRTDTTAEALLRAALKQLALSTAGNSCDDDRA